MTGRPYHPSFIPIGGEAGQLFGAVGDALGSSQVDQRERAVIRCEVEELIALAGLRTALVGGDRRSQTKRTS